MIKRNCGCKGLKVSAMLLLTVLMFAPQFVLGGSLSGKVTDYSDGQGLVHAVVTVISSDASVKDRGVAADENGNFKFDNIPEGIYSIKISYVGFTTFSEFDLEISASGDKELNATLVPIAINLQSISVSASRRPEKLVDAPAAVSLVDAEQIAERTTLTPTEHIKNLPGVDVATTGLNQSNVVVRGFNNIFSGALLVLTDNRIARVPSLRFNAHNFISTVNEDIERIEVVSGPGSALYGPNSASGVMHIITKSPFTSQGTSFSFGGGERELGIGSFRHAGLINEKIAYKITGQYYKGEDWKHTESMEPDSIALYRPTVNGPDTTRGIDANNRDYSVKKIAGDGRIDFILSDNAGLTLNGGFNQNNSIELTGLGAGQAIDWAYYYGQARFTYKDLFLQAFVNASDAGDTYLLNTGQLIVDKSKLWVAQMQHRYAPNRKLSLTYGLDALFTRPNTESTINGRNEEDDNINEFGTYVQGDYKLNEQFKFVGAARIDNNNQLEDMVFSPRAGLVYQPNANNNFRFTYNRAFSTPDNNNLFLDILSASTQFFDLRVQGVPESGFHWSINDNGAQFKSFMNPLGADEYIDFNDPTFTNVMWTVGRSTVTDGFIDQLGVMQLPQPMLDAVEASLNNTIPTNVTATDNTLKTFDPDIFGFVPSTLEDIADIDRMKPTTTETFEIGYKGVINNKLQFSINGYRTKKQNFVGPLTVETPNVFLDQGSLFAELYPQVEAYLSDPANAVDAATLGALDLDNPDQAILGDTPWAGYGNGTFADELAALYAGGAEQIPFGIVTPMEAFDANTVLITYRNFGEISFYGFDMAVAYHLNRNWNVGGTYSYVTKNFFEKSADQVHDIHLNAPKNKFGLSLDFTHPKRQINASIRGRYIDAFEMDSPFMGSTVESYFVMDLNVGVNLYQNTRFSLTIQNVADNRHYEFIGAPKIGRLAIARITQSL